MSLFVHRQGVVFPSNVVCGNCVNYDPLEKCPQQLRFRPCLNFEPLDPGNDIETVEEIPFRRETLGSAEVGKHSTKVPVDVADADDGKDEEEEAEVE